VALGEEHPFYDRTDYRDLANASFSLVAMDHGRLTGDILVDAGHGTIQSLLSGVNRIPDCICLTHGHMDHTLSVDWVVQSYWRQHGKETRYPVYATRPVYRFLVQSYPQLEEIVEFRELEPGQGTRLELEREITVTAFPVYHGRAAPGASMLLFETGGKRVLFTGDLFTPLLRQADYGLLRGVDLVVVDSNNRFPWPGTNHWSFAGDPGNPMKRHGALLDFLREHGVSHFTRPRGQGGNGTSARAYLEQCTGEWDVASQPFTVLEFLERIGAGRVMLVHYSGAEDEKHHGEPVMDSLQLEEWVRETAARAGCGSRFIIPAVGEEVEV